MIVIVIGPSGSGKTTVGSLLAQKLSWPFQDADDLHPLANVEKMRGGQPLTETDRKPWLQALRDLIDQHLSQSQPVVLACSALKPSHRDLLFRQHPDVRFVYLKVPKDLLQTRLQQRTGHFMPALLLESQLDTFEFSEDLLVVDATVPPRQIVARIETELALDWA